MEQIETSEFDKVKANLDKYPLFKELLSEDWINSKILTEENRFKKHYLFWYLLDDSKSKFLFNDLNIVKNDTKIASFISKIKKFKDQDNFDPFRTELQIYAYYKSKENDDFKVEYEPSVPESPKNNDILIKYNGENYYIEIFTLTHDGIDRYNRDLQHKTTIEINKIENNPFIISYRLLTSFEESDISPLINFIEEEIDKFKAETEQDKEIMFSIDEVNKAEVWLRRDLGIDKGFVGVIHSEVRELSNDRRLKNWILTKTDQVSENTKNILITNLLYPPMSFSDYYNGLIGQEALRINKETLESTPFRHKNGAIFDDRTKKFAGFVVYQRGNYVERKKHINPNANNNISEELLNLL